MDLKPHPHHACRHDDDNPQKPWFRPPITFWIAGTGHWYTASLFIPALHHFRHAFEDYTRMMLVPVVIGFAAGGLIDYYVPQEYISKHLGGKQKRTILYATGLGFLMSACSHGILALSVELHKK